MKLLCGLHKKKFFKPDKWLSTGFEYYYIPALTSTRGYK